MLPHGSAKLTALASQCAASPLTSVNGWQVDVWDMSAADVDLAVEIYQAVLAGDVTSGDPVVAKLATQGVDLPKLLSDAGEGLELVTRADIAEYAAAASVIATDGFTVASMLMPNIPKMGRRKSDSGVDVFDVQLDATASGPALVTSERLGLASVKHTLTIAASGLRLAIVKSVSPKHELNQVYLTQQLRVVVGRLQSEGMVVADARRTFLFMADFPDPAHVGLFGVAVVDPSLRDAMVAQLSNLPTVTGGHMFRIVTFPDLANVHLRCP
jgi:hypothetical protein